MSAPNMRTTNESLAGRQTTNESLAGRRTIIGVFDGPNHAETALNELRAAGFAPEQISVVAKDTRETTDLVADTGMGGGEGVATGAVLGGITGGVLGWLVGIGALAIPGIGPIVAAGALATTLGGAAIGAAAGGLLGALVDLGVPEEDARIYESSVRAGSILLTVNALSAEEARRARAIFDRHGGSEVRYYGDDATDAMVDDRDVRQGRARDLQSPAGYRDDAVRRDDDSAARI
jgi:heat induced stress protein YflT